jgi:hypothetical protein
MVVAENFGANELASSRGGVFEDIPFRFLML